MNAPLARPWLVLTGLALGVTVTNGFARFAYGLILPAMKSEMGWTYAQAGWLNTANALGYIAGALLTMALIRHIPPTRLFAIGLVTTTLALLATGLHAALWWQTVWRITAGVVGAMSFSTAGALAAGLFQGDPRRNALAIAILFGSGGGLGIVLAGAALPLMLDAWGAASWPLGWIVIGAMSLSFVPLGLWAAFQLRAPVQKQGKPVPLPIRRMLPELLGYAGFGLGYIVYLTFLSAWMTEQQASAPFIALVWVVLGVSICLSPLVWRPILARFASGVPLAMILTGIAIGSALPVLLPKGPVLLISAVVFGLSVFMAPGAVTNFARQNLPAESWGRAISLFTVVFAVAQTAGPYGAGLVGDLFGNIGISLLAASGLLMLGAFAALMQKPLDDRP
ncbi:MAG: YbfB/YjiJ family MFS transporter [Paracoccaceae bacterium]|jgi:MFS family permease|uniref:YbfB/YjiJ family MFS transporter n=1 Tax=unclassified Seohaeicola TaxID=2641111 RepID=UPI00237A40C9|nr:MULTISPECIES: YbfB/YjiJ family MFS transporter [unclassified Seohaeicola]MDD9705779.1 YbfB/YjiJ family MFS transporter [Seohaeicola sp. 4SK31]MDD9735290.1 YbfB/YjiJ family MFS transporter [Seohaeicola sp. SP36]MDF1708640.1 YbfB/YjiJ family MFS transporter [Paracoccaceae bacterium]